MDDLIRLLEETGIDTETAYEMLEPLVKNNIESVFSNGCIEALTGPIERNDVQTVEHHSQNLGGEERKACYLAVGNMVTKLAEKKHPEWDYGEMRRVLKQKESE